MRTPIDAELFSAYQEIGTIEPIAYLAASPETLQQKELFCTGDIELPVLTYPKAQDLPLARWREQLQRLDAMVQDHDHPVVQLAYPQLIEEKLLHIDLLEAVQNGDDVGFKLATEGAYGTPDLAIARRLVPHIRSLIGWAAEQNLEELLPSIDYISTVIGRLDADEETAVAPAYFPDDPADVDADAIEERFQEAFDSYGISGWTVRRTDTDFIAINHEAKAIQVPNSRKVSKGYLEALVVHEIGVHVRRRVFAQVASLQLLQAGLGYYIRGEEGLCKFEEHKVYPAALNKSVENYFGIAMVYGLDGKPWDMRQAFTFYWHYHRLTLAGQDYTEADLDDYAWKRVYRLFRGTTGGARGVCLTKDLSYLRGYLAATTLAERYPLEEQRFLVGKYDPANEVHRRILDMLSITHDGRTQ